MVTKKELKKAARLLGHESGSGNIIGGQQRIADLCGVKKQAVYRWFLLGRLPSSEYMGKTRYAGIIEDATGGEVKAIKLCPNCPQYMGGEK